MHSRRRAAPGSTWFVCSCSIATGARRRASPSGQPPAADAGSTGADESRSREWRGETAGRKTSRDREIIAGRYRLDPKVRKLAQTVVPVAGLLAQSGATLREAEYKALDTLASAPRDDAEALYLSADRFVQAETSISLTSMEREHLLDRFGLFGVRLAVALIRQGAANTATELSTELVRRSGLVELRDVLLSQFAQRRDVLKARSALLALESVLQEQPVPDRDALASELERITSGAHEFAEIRLLNALRAGGIKVKPAEAAEMVATCAFSLRVLTGFEIARNTSTAAFKPRSRPRLMSMALAPATTLRTPSANIACASNVDVLVPSPTASPVFSAACRNICAPRFSSGSFRSTSLAIVTPSLQTIGTPHFF